MVNEQPLELERSLLSSFATLVRQWGSLTTDWGFARSAGVEVPDNVIRILFALGSRSTDFRPSDLAEHLGMSRASLSKSLTFLRSAGMVAGEAAPGDRRAVHVSLTTEGKLAYTRVLEAAIAQIRNAADGFSEKELRTIVRFMNVYVGTFIDEEEHLLPTQPN